MSSYWISIKTYFIIINGRPSQFSKQQYFNFILFSLFFFLACCLSSNTDGSNCYTYLYCGRSNRVQITNIKDTTVVTLEVDMNSRKMFFFVSEKQIPYCVKNIPLNIFFSVCYLIIFILYVLFKKNSYQVLARLHLKLNHFGCYHHRQSVLH